MDVIDKEAHYSGFNIILFVTQSYESNQALSSLIIISIHNLTLPAKTTTFFII